MKSEKHPVTPFELVTPFFRRCYTRCYTQNIDFQLIKPVVTPVTPVTPFFIGFRKNECLCNQF